MKIGVLIVGDEEYGVQTMLQGLLGAMIAGGAQCEVFALNRGPLAIALQDAGAIVTCSDRPPPPDFGVGLLKAIKSFLQVLLYSISVRRDVLKWICKTRVPALIVRMPNLVMIGASVSRAAHIPAFWIMPNAVSDGYFLHLNKLVYELIFLLSPLRPVANSAYTASTLLNWTSTPQILHLGVDGARFDGAQVRPVDLKFVGLSSGIPTLGLFARLIEEKGHMALVESLALLDSDIQVLIVGGPLGTGYHERLVHEIFNRGLAERVKIIGPISDVRPYYLACSFTVNLRQTPEPFGLSVIESMMLGIPVLAHRAGGPGETIVDNETGWLIDESTPAAIAVGLAKALECRGAWKQMGAAAARHARQFFDTQVVSDNFQAILKGATNSALR